MDLKCRIEKTFNYENKSEFINNNPGACRSYVILFQLIEPE